MAVSRIPGAGVFLRPYRIFIGRERSAYSLHMASRSTPPPRRPVGTVTRGTTNPNRLRRMDRWIAATHGAALRHAQDPVAVDLGYGAAPWTAVELLARLRVAAPRAGWSASRSNRRGWRARSRTSARG